MNKFRCYTGKGFYADFEAYDADAARLACVERYGKCLGVAEIVEAKEPFDITKHEWSDDFIGAVNIDGNYLLINDIDYNISTISMNKDDAIAIAKHFGIIK